MKVDVQIVLDNLEQVETPRQNRILKSALRNLVYHAETYGHVTAKDIGEFINAAADGTLGQSPKPQ